MSLYFKIIFISSFILFCLQAYGQDHTPSIQDWITDLSIKKDPRLSRYNKASREILTLDSSQYCAILNRLRDEGPHKNQRFITRLKIIESQMQLQGKKCGTAQASTDILKEALQLAYEIGDDALLFNVHRNLSAAYAIGSNFGSATLHALLALEIAERLGDGQLEPGSNDWYLLGFVLYHSREYEASIKASSNALRSNDDTSLPEDSLSWDYKMNALNTIGLAYEKLNKPDSAFSAFDQALTIASRKNNEFWKGIITGNKGDVYYKLGQYDSAEVMLTYDYEQSLAFAQFDNAAHSLQWLARIKLNRGDPVTALKLLREAAGLLPENARPEYRVLILDGLRHTFTELGSADSANYYSQKYLTLHDSLERSINDNRLEIVRMQMESQQNMYKVITLNKEKRKIALIRNLIIAIILLIAITGLMILNRQKLKLKLRQIEALQQKNAAEKETSEAREQLAFFTRNLLEKTNMIETLQLQLMSKELTEEQSQYISALTQHSILTDDDWEKFKGLFEKVYPGFFTTLRQRFADITLAELRMAALCKLQVTAKEASNLLGISPNSVNKTRQRLRSRLGLDTNEELEQYFAGFNP